MWVCVQTGLFLIGWGEMKQRALRVIGAEGIVDWSMLQAELERQSIKLAVQTTGWVQERGETNVSFPDRETLRDDTDRKFGNSCQNQFE